MKYLKIFIVAAACLLVFYIGRIVYEILCISCTIPPIRDYQYSGSLAEFKDALYKLKASHKEIDVKNDDGIWINIVIKNDTTGNDTTKVEYDFTCYQDSTKKGYKTEVELIGALSNVKPYGGYAIGADGVTPLLTRFDREFMRKLKEEQNIILIPNN